MENVTLTKRECDSWKAGNIWGKPLLCEWQNTLRLSTSQKHDAAFQSRCPERGPHVFPVDVPGVALRALSCLNPALVLQGPPRVGVTLALPSCVAYPLQMPGGVMLQPAPGKGNEEVSKLAVPWGCLKTVPGTVGETGVKVKWVEPIPSSLCL